MTSTRQTKIKQPPRLEKSIAADIRQVLELAGYRAVRCIAGPVRNMKGAGRYAPQHGNPEGYPDWLFVRSHPLVIWSVLPYAIFIEVKRPGEKPRPLQLAWLDVLRNDGFTAKWFDGFREGEGRRPFMPWWEGVKKGNYILNAHAVENKAKKVLDSREGD